MKRYFFLYLAFFVLFGISAADAACPCDPQIRRQLEDKATSDGVVKVIVGLDMKFTPEGKLEGRGAFLQRNAIANARTRLVESMSASVFAGVRFVADYATIPYVALEVDPDALAFLLDSKLVSSIEEDVPVPPDLAESVPLIQGDQAWAIGATGSGQTVAILDTGVSKTHPFLLNKVVAEGCYSTTSSGTCESVCPGGVPSSTASGSGVNCDPSVDGCGHGTHVAGIAAGKGSESSGVAKDAKIIAIQVFSKFTTTADCTTTPPPCVLSYTSNQISGLERVYALRNTYKIAAVNMSLGGGSYSDYCDSDSRKAIIDNLRSAGIATVIASGNNGYLGYISKPACISTSVSVGATTKSDTVASYSNSSTMVRLLAPGSSIRSSVPGGTYESWNGTSMATPHVTGAWAVLKSRYPDATVAAILNAFRQTGTMITDYDYTMPRINIKSAIDFLNPNSSVPADFNADGKPDLLFQEMNARQLYVWYMNGVARTGGAYPNPKTLSNNWKVVSTADFNADGKPDILLQETSAKQLYVWYMNGVTRTGGTYLNPKTVSNNWRVAAAADFNGDGKTDLLMQEHSTKQLYVWYMNGINRTGGVFLNPKTVSNSWKVVGAADMNADGKPDIVLQEASTKQLYVWYMNGINRTGGAFLNPKTLSNNWKVVAVQDMNADGKPDLVLQEFTTRQLYTWYMNGINRTGGAYLNPKTIGGAWRAVGGNGAWVTIAASASSGATETPDRTDGARAAESPASGSKQGGCDTGTGLIATLLLLPMALAGSRKK